MPGDLAVGTPLGFPTLDQAGPSKFQAPPSLRVSPGLTQRSQATVFKPLLVAPHRARGAAKGASDIVLIGPSLLDEVHHGISFSQVVAQPILRHHDPADNHRALVPLSFDHAAVVDDESAFCISGVRKEIITWARSHTGQPYTSGRKADSFGFAPRAIQRTQKNLEIRGNWPHQRGGAKKSGQFWVRTLATEKPLKCPGNPKKRPVLCQEFWNPAWTMFNPNYNLNAPYKSVLSLWGNVAGYKGGFCVRWSGYLYF